MRYDIPVQRKSVSSLDQVDFSNIPFGKVISDHMFIADYDGEKWQDLRIVPYGDMTMAPSNLALHYGQSIFEGMKATICNGEPTLMRPYMHARRMNLSAERMCMPSVPEDLFVQAVSKLIDVDRGFIPKGDDHALYLRPFMFATDELFGVQASKTYRFMIFTGPVGPYYPKPVRLWVEEVFTRAAQGGAGEAKCAGNYGASLLPAMRAKKAGYDQVMWMDAIEKKYVQEVGTMNLFFVMDGKVVTPATTGTILRGITRDCFLTILKDHGYTVEDRLVSITEVFDAHWRGALTEVFGAGTAAVVSHVSDITWRDNVIMLPEVSETSRPVSTFLKRYLNDLRTGRTEDRYGWLHGIDTNEAIHKIVGTVKVSV
jgi:branched-chain amino acid aminotransferase